MLDRKTLENTANEGGSFIVKPSRLYEKSANLNYEDIKEGDLVVATAHSFIPGYAILLRVGEIAATMDICDYDNEKDADKRKKSIYACIGKNVVARVLKKEYGVLVLERKSVINDTIDYLSRNLGTIVDATVESICSYGLFVDIGNGIVSMVHIQEVSKSRINNLKVLFNIGDKIKVRLLEFNSENSFFIVSRKQAYEKLDENNLPQGTCIIVTCFDYVNEKKDGVYVEFDPINVGILDIPLELASPDEFYVGRKVAVAIKKFKERGFACSFVNFI